MRISDWSSDVCSSDLRDALYFSAERSVERHRQPAAAWRDGRGRRRPRRSRDIERQAQHRRRLFRRRILEALRRARHLRSEEHTSELQSLMRISYAVFCLKKKNKQNTKEHTITHPQKKDNKHHTSLYSTRHNKN